ncbi:MAG: M48 family metallopeptidase [Deltaproteobacteria bacterium]|nr:M48 family metallopeptidase [Deltaproteobacteria bacterium]
MIKLGLAVVLAADACTIGTVKIENPVEQVKHTVKRAAGTEECTPQQLWPYTFSAEDEYWFGRNVADRLLAPYVPAKIYEPDSPQAIYLNEVGNVVAAASAAQRDDGGGYHNDLPRKFPARARLDDTADRPLPIRGYHFILVKDPQPVALGLPGGFVIVSDGLVARTTDEDQLAGVLAHELGHVTRGHGIVAIEKMLCGRRDSVFAQASQNLHATKIGGGLALNLPLDKAIELFDQGVNYFQDIITTKGYPAAYEGEADAYGTRYLAGASYSALALADLLNHVDKDPAFKPTDDEHERPASRATKVTKLVTDEKLQPGHSPYEADRTKRFGVAFPPQPASTPAAQVKTKS